MKRTIALLLLLTFALALAACGQKSTETATESLEPASASRADELGAGDTKVLVAYFSQTGNTKPLAEHAAELLHADLYEITAADPYTDADINYSDSDSRTSKEQNDPDARPAIAGSVENMEQYDIIYLVYPIWHYTLSVPACAFLDEYDLSGKTICAFAANAGSRFADSLERISEAEPDAVVIEGVSVSEKEIDGAEETVKNRVREIEKELSEASLAEQTKDQDMKLMIGETAVAVAWEDNESVKELKKLAGEGPVTINMSMYGGFEQVGAIGSSLVSNDVQTVTEPGDIVLYADSQIVIFYGSNSWAYTRLGKITDCTNEELASLLGNGDVTITLSL